MAITVYILHELEYTTCIRRQLIAHTERQIGGQIHTVHNSIPNTFQLC